jgi:hypothetical protein
MRDKEEAAVFVDFFERFGSYYEIKPKNWLTRNKTGRLGKEIRLEGECEQLIHMALYICIWDD